MHPQKNPKLNELNTLLEKLVINLLFNNFFSDIDLD